ncbi:MAG TPA: ABC transporter permease subunit [bacterium]|nr:ABC transporter permease subunit [bacterium]
MIVRASGWLRQRLAPGSIPPSAAQPLGPDVRTVFAKELLEASRDRRTLLVMILLPAIIMPLATLGIPYLEQRQQRAIATSTPSVAIVGQASGLVHLAYTTKLIRPVKTNDPVKALRERRVLAVLKIPQGMEATIARDGQVHVVIQYDASDSESVAARNKVVDLISRYSQQVVARRLLARHLNPTDLLPVVLDERNVATQRQLSGLLLASLLPFFIAMWAVVGGMSVAVDLAAGEKERGTLESLLVTPPTREAIVVGKFLAVLAASLGSVIIVITTMMLSLRWGYPYLVHTSTKLDVSLPLGTAVVLLGIALLFSGLVSAIQLAVSVYARSPREAQQYVTPLYFAIVLPGLAVQYISEWQATSWVYLMPVLNTFFSFRELLLGTINWWHLALTAVSCIFYATLILEVAIWLFGRESVIFRT